MIKKLIKRIVLEPNDDDTISIKIDPSQPMEKKNDKEDESMEYMMMGNWCGELTATASDINTALEKIKEMVKLNASKGERPKNILSAYLSK